MEVDPLETAESAHHGESHRPALGGRVAVTVALLATFLGICKVKDDNIVQAMERSENERLDHWNFYQARNIREDVAKSTATELELSSHSAPAAEQARYQDAIAQYRKLAADENSKKDELRVEAENDQKTYDALNYRDDQFDLSDTLIALAISLLAVTALTHKEWLFWIAMVPTVFGVTMGLAGLLGWHIHPDGIIRLLGG
jgi:hypothetical protein